MISGAAVARLLLYLGALTVIGDAALGERGDERRGVRAGAWVLLAAAVLSLLLLQARDMELDPTVAAWQSMLTGTTWGRHWFVLASVVCIGVVASTRRASDAKSGAKLGIASGVDAGAARRIVGSFGAVALAVALAVAMGGLGHAAADELYPLLARAVDAAHLLSAGAWIGGLGLVAWGARRASGAPTSEWRALSRLATFAAPVAVVSGVVSGWRRVTAVQVGDAGGLALPPLSSLLATDYGQLLLIKLGLVLVMLALGQMHRRRVLREHAPSGTAIRFELALAFAVLAVTGVLTGTAPPGE